VLTRRIASIVPHTCLQALARPVRLRIHIPTQALVALFIWSHNTGICTTAALQHPAAQQATTSLYSALSALLVLLPYQRAALAPRLRHGPTGKCSAVLTFAELLLLFLAPTLVLAARESLLYVRWRRAWQRWWQWELHARERLRGKGMRQAAGSSGGGSSRRGREAAGTAATAGSSGEAAGAASGFWWCPGEQEAASSGLQGEAAARPLAAKAPLPPFVEPPGWLASHAYRLVHACLHLQALLCSCWPRPGKPSCSPHPSTEECAPLGFNSTTNYMHSSQQNTNFFLSCPSAFLAVNLRCKPKL